MGDDRREVPTGSRIRSSVLIASLGLLASCGGSSPLPSTGPVASFLAVRGIVKGGQQPVSGATIQLYAVGSGGDGSAASPLITSSTVTTNATGEFTISGTYSCPQTTSLVYLVVTGGNPGLTVGTTNSNLALMAALGQCNNILSNYIEVNELTTVGSIAALYPYMLSYSYLGSGTSDASALSSAFSTAAEYMNSATGAVPGSTLPAGDTASSTLIATLADILATCINSSGGVAGDSSACGNLFSLATPLNGVSPTDTIGAAIDILNNPTNNAASIFALLNATPPYLPVLSSTPTTWAAPIEATPTVGNSYYVNCSASTNGTGTQASPWNSLSGPNGVTFGAGDSMYFARGSTCNGEFTPKGGGSSGSPVTITAYGTGALPILNGGTSNQFTLFLNDVQYYEISDLAVIGSTNFAIIVTGSTNNKILNHIYLSNLDVSAVNHQATSRTDGGLVQFDTEGTNEAFNDIQVTNVTAHNSTAGEGIAILAAYTASFPQTVFNTNVVVKNNTVHDVDGDGILVSEANGVVIENNVVYNTGLCPSTCTGSTPVGLWTFYSNNALVQYNESYSNESWSNADGGSFDIDYWNQNNTYQYNYGHDSQGYCVLIYTSAQYGTLVTSNSVFRFNICANNVQKDTSMGEIFVSAGSGGTLNGVQIYNNTIYLNGVSGSYAIRDSGSYSGTVPNFFENNIVYSSLPTTIYLSSHMTADYNLYYSTTSYSFIYNGTTYTTFAAYKTGSSQDAHGINADPKFAPYNAGVGGCTDCVLSAAEYHGTQFPSNSNGYYTLLSTSPALGAGTNVCATSCITGTMGITDFFGNPIPTKPNIGAY